MENQIEEFVNSAIGKPPIKKILPEWLNFLLLLVVGAVTYSLSSLDQLTPLLMVVLFILHFGFCSMTRFTEHEVRPLLHYNRGVQGITILSMLLVSLGYLITFLIDNGSGSYLDAVNRANLCVEYTYLIIIWGFFASISVIGIYFAVLIVVRWFPYLVSMVHQIEPPFILYINVILISLIALGVWITYGIFLFKSILKRENYGPNTEKIFRVAKIHLFFSILFSPLLILFENKIWVYLVNIL